jgi:hypothetical protein
LLTLFVTFIAAAGPVFAQEGIGLRRVGVRGGVTIDPDQAHVGLHIDAGKFHEKVRFQPSFEVGFGSDVVTGAINLDAFYLFNPGAVQPYAGGGLGVAIFDFDRDERPGRSGTDVEAGLNLVGGMEWGDRNAYMLEARVGIGDIPDFKLTIGIIF